MNGFLQFAAILAGIFLLAILVMWITLPISLMKKLGGVLIGHRQKLDKIIEREANNLLADIDSKLTPPKREVKEGIRIE